MDGELDDVAFFAGALTDQQIADRWDQSLSDRLAAGLEPDLVPLCPVVKWRADDTS